MTGAILTKLGRVPRTETRRTRDLHERVDAVCELEVGGGEASGGMGGDRDLHLAPRDRDVRVMSHLLGRAGDPADELDRTDEVSLVERLGDLIALAAPT